MTSVLDSGPTGPVVARLPLLGTRQWWGAGRRATSTICAAVSVLFFVRLRRLPAGSSQAAQADRRLRAERRRRHEVVVTISYRDLPADRPRWSLDVVPRREIIPPHPQQSVRVLTHDFPSEICGWGAHPEYEIHLITKTHGSFIAGDHIGTFGPGHVSILGPNLPHDWVSDLEPGEVLENRDAVIQFDGRWVEQAAALVPELAEVGPLLEQSRRGIEFLGGSAEEAAAAIEAMGATSGLQRLQHLFALFGILTRAPQEERRYLAEEWFRPQLDGQAAAVVDLEEGQ